MTLGTRLRQLRLRMGQAAGLVNSRGEPRGYTQEEIADVMGVGQGRYSWYENDDRRPTLWRIQRLAKFYKMSVAEAFPQFKMTPEEKEHLAQGREILASR